MRPDFKPAMRGFFHVGLVRPIPSLTLSGIHLPLGRAKKLAATFMLRSRWAAGLSVTPPYRVRYGSRLDHAHLLKSPAHRHSVPEPVGSWQGWWRPAVRPLKAVLYMKCPLIVAVHSTQRREGKRVRKCPSSMG